jgi:tricorn protease
MSRGYFRFPAVLQNRVVFTSEDDLWEVPLQGGTARRLTAGRGSFLSPQFSPDGRWLAFASAEEGHVEVFVMPAEGGDLIRLTYLGALSIPCSWLDAETVLFRSTAYEAHYVAGLCAVAAAGGLPRSLRLGPASSLVLSEAGQAVLARASSRAEPSYWKRYRGGTAGKLWIAPSLEGEYAPLIDLNGNLACPLWVGTRIYFISDHEGIGNLYSCTPNGGDLRLEASHGSFYIRNLTTDGRTIVYHAAGDIHALDIATRTSRKLAIEYHSQRTQRQRRYIKAAKYLEAADLDPKGESCVYTVRGQIHQIRHFDGPDSTRCIPGSRYRLARFLSDGRRVIAAVDKDNGEERLEIWDTRDYSVTPVPEPAGSASEGWGRLTLLEASPKGDYVAFANHRNELWLLNLAAGTSRKLAANAYGPMGTFAWSPDGRWLAFQESQNRHQYHIAIASTETNDIHVVTKPLFVDYAPSFDPDGRYLYFLSDRLLNPVYDSVQFELSFPKTVLPCLVTLKKDMPSPFLEAVTDDADDKVKGKDKREEEHGDDLKVDIDFDGIESRILAFPVPEGRYWVIKGLKKKAMWLSFPVKGALMGEPASEPRPAEGTLEAFDFRKLKVDALGSGFSDVRISADRKQMLLFAHERLRVAKAGEKLEDDPAKKLSAREAGWVDLERLKILIEPEAEWRQMLHEAWRLQRDHFWRADMSKVDWKAVLLRYAPLVQRVNCRSEFADLVWEMQGELGTSHAYDFGGDYREEPVYPIGFLGADFAWDAAASGYRIRRFLRGDPWAINEACPLKAPGVQLELGDVIMAINGQRLSAAVTPHHALMHRAEAEVYLSVQTTDSFRQVRVRTLRNEKRARYRDWVEGNRDYVREATNGRAGYIHIPDMMAEGFAEFHRHFLRDYDCDGLIVDVRYNRGGHISQLLLEKLCRQRLGADFTRWFGVFPFPDASPAGPLVALTNEFAGSDGDIFSHTFKLKKAGPLIGRRTWGGVIGIWPRHSLVDGGTTTQPEFSFWFSDVGWKVENYGTDPDIDVDIAPHEFRQGRDTQLDRGVSEVLKLLEMQPPFRPMPDDDPRGLAIRSTPDNVATPRLVVKTIAE